jgi:hypothetical protein
MAKSQKTIRNYRTSETDTFAAAPVLKSAIHAKVALTAGYELSHYDVDPSFLEDDYMK